MIHKEQHATDTNVGSKYPELNKYFPFRGKWVICGHEDARHRLWDAIIDRPEDDEFIAWDYNLHLESVIAVRRIRPYNLTN